MSRGKSKALVGRLKWIIEQLEAGNPVQLRDIMAKFGMSWGGAENELDIAKAQLGLRALNQMLDEVRKGMLRDGEGRVIQPIGRLGERVSRQTGKSKER